MEIPPKTAEKFLQALLRGVWQQAVEVEARANVSFQSYDLRTAQNDEKDKLTVEEGGGPPV